MAPFVQLRIFYTSYKIDTLGGKYFTFRKLLDKESGKLTRLAM